MASNISAEKVLQAIRNQFAGEQNTAELFDRVYDLLPNGFDGKVTSVSGNIKNFKADIRLNLKTLDDIVCFVKQYGEINHETLRRLTPINHGQSSDFLHTVYYRCHHKTNYSKTMNAAEVLKYNPSKRLKNTDCRFSAVFKLKKDQLEEHTCLMTLEYNHNHSVTALQTLTFKDILSTTKHAIKQLFENGHTPRTAFKIMQEDVKKQTLNDLEAHKLSADRSILPLRRDFNSLYTEFKREKFGSKNLSSMFSVLGEKIKNLRELDNYLVSFQPFNEEENDPLILVLISPLMQRVHSMVSNSGELGFVDSSSNMEEYNLRVFAWVTNSNLGALPLAIVITRDETENTLTQGFELLKTVFRTTHFMDGVNLDLKLS